jgi:hypothetical protein
MRRYFFAALLLTACVTGDDIDARLRSWVGAKADELVTAWGAPLGQYTLKDGSRVLSYERSSVASSGPGGFGHTYSRLCHVDFTVAANDEVAGARWTGAVDQCGSYVRARNGGEL